MRHFQHQKVSKQQSNAGAYRVPDSVRQGPKYWHTWTGPSPFVHLSAPEEFCLSRAIQMFALLLSLLLLLFVAGPYYH